MFRKGLLRIEKAVLYGFLFAIIVYKNGQALVFYINKNFMESGKDVIRQSLFLRWFRLPIARRDKGIKRAEILGGETEKEEAER